MLLRSIIAPFTILLAMAQVSAGETMQIVGNGGTPDPQKRVGGPNYIKMYRNPDPNAGKYAWTSGVEGNSVYIDRNDGVMRLTSGSKTLPTNKFHIYIAQPRQKGYYLKGYILDRNETCLAPIDQNLIQEKTEFFMAATKYW
jgi:hypothetical protein